MKARLTDKARALLRALEEAEAALAQIWREPFEGYDARTRMDWLDRQSKATKVYETLWRQF